MIKNIIVMDKDTHKSVMTRLHDVLIDIEKLPDSYLKNEVERKVQEAFDILKGKPL